ncbi:hypothetical protein Glove_152g95 [Diversispora epigaea]|uniref:G domain-containing protein n=1 Tax=Diversispora epigaea TaxID=1348612 RepID=A0A397IXB0_9GLOM|nr:hypothetical protein Glove_152g95 [Diversispora epigaea]
MLLRVLFVFLLCIISPSISVVTILPIGKTGLGKSFTAKLLGFEDAEVGNDENSMTKEVKIYKNEKYKYIDTPGFDDSENVDDEETINGIVSMMHKEKITELNILLWFVSESDKATNSLQKQAKFIEELAMYNKKNVWDNVIVIFKGHYNQFRKASESIKGAIKKNNQSSNLDKLKVFPVWLYDALPDDSPDRNKSDEELREGGIYSNEALLDFYNDLAKEEQYKSRPIQIIFNDAVCTKCGKKSDPRLARTSLCHTNIRHIHEETEKYNVPNGERYHPGNLQTKYDSGNNYHPGYLRTKHNSDWEKVDGALKFIPIINMIGIIGKAATNKKVWSCCERGEGSYGCKYEGRKLWSCCNGNEGSNGCKEMYDTKWRYTCCHKDLDENPPGCKKVCRSCDRTWGNSTGCSDKNHEFKFDENVSSNRLHDEL